MSAYILPFSSQDQAFFSANSDPYVRVFLLVQKAGNKTPTPVEFFKTNVIKKTLDPVWNATCEYPRFKEQCLKVDDDWVDCDTARQIEEIQGLRFDVYDKDKFVDDFLGTFNVGKKELMGAFNQSIQVHFSDNLDVVRHNLEKGIKFI
jgi:hypothetical protein